MAVVFELREYLEFSVGSWELVSKVREGYDL
jgi:hypothetical protein